MKKILLLIIIFSSSLSISAADNAETKKLLHSYKVKCDLVADKPIVLKMADTLYSMADKLQSHNYKITAKCLKLTYFFSKPGTRDSISKYCNEVKKMCHGSDDDIFYYFSWAESISDHISRREFNLALNEINDLRKLSEAKHKMMGLATCYSQMTDLYSEKGNYNLAAQYMKKSISLTEKYKLDEYNISVYYTTLALLLLKDNHSDEAYHYICDAYKTARISGHTLQVMAAEAEYWYQKRNVERVKLVLEKSKKLNTAFDDRPLYAAEYYYDMVTSNYKAAEPALEKMYSIGAMQKSDYLYRKAQIYEKIPGAEKTAFKCWKDYADFKDSISRNDAEIEIAEFATLMDMTQLKLQNQQMQLKEKSSSLHRSIAFLIASLLFIIILSFFMIKIVNINKRLKASRRKLIRQKDELTYAKKIITREKEYIQIVHDMEEAFVKNIQYELSGPANSIIGFGQALHEVSNNPEEVKNCADVIEQTGKNLHKMLSEMGILFSLHLDKSKIDLSPVSLNEICRVAISQIKKVADEKTNIIQNRWDDEFAILSDSNSIAAIIKHLIDNAIKYAQGSEIAVKTYLSDDNKFVNISVTDNGPGIPKEKHEKVFDGFTKLDNFVQGVGLGLPISRITATRINATITIDESYTKGCRFILSIPALKFEE